jgi:glycosyltransferase involved in cell wall biosynthesis
MGNKVFIVIAAYNEQNSVPKVIKELQKAGYKDIVVVDDGSKDKTFEAALNAGATVLQHIINRGQGAALKTGIDYALEQGADIIVTFDADGQHRVEDIPAMIKPVAGGKVDVTFGSRFLTKKSQENVPFVRKACLKGGILVLWLFYGVRMTDAHNGFRALSRNAAEKIRITSDRMAHASEIVEEVHRLDLKYREVPVVIRYTEETLKKGHGSFMEGVRILYTMIMKKFLLR